MMRFFIEPSEIRIPLVNFPDLYCRFTENVISGDTQAIERKGADLLANNFTNEKETMRFINRVFA